MARASLIALLVLCNRAVAAPPLAVRIGLGDGIGWASRAGTYRDDAAVALRVGAAIGARLVVELALHEDLERLEPAFGAGARYALDDAWYVRGELALVGGSDLLVNYDATAAAGYRAGPMYVEVATTERFGELATTALHVELGLALGR